ncbi:MAG: diguanylate cyclase [Gammaproteobacteria bacterium]|nr:diguanylate cyclase [Gammaproteobacteria bacterium]
MYDKEHRTADPLTAGHRGACHETDESERASAETLMRMQKCALRLAFAFYGRYPELDHELTHLRAQLRLQKRHGTVATLIEDVLGTIIRLESEHRVRTEDSAFDALALVADKLRWPPASLDAATRLQRRLGLRASRGSVQDAVDEICALLGGCIDSGPASAPASTAVAQDIGSPVQGLARMLERIDAPAELEPAFEGLRKRLGDIADQAGLLDVLGQIAGLLADHLHGADAPALWTEPLLQLLDRVSFPPEFTADVQALRNRLGKPSPARERNALVTQVSNLVARMQQQLRAELDDVGNFMRRTMLRLQDLQVQLLRSDRIREEAFRDRERINSMVQQHVSGIRMSMDQAVTIDELRASIDSQLDSVNADMTAFIDAERVRNEHTDRAVSALSTQLKDLESETLQLRESLKEEHAKAVRDALTGIANRLGYEERMALEFARWRRHGRELSLIVFDLDRFKSINDAYGHQAGDKVLVTVAEQLRRQIRESDFFARYGGEEFVLILPETSLADAMALAEKLRQNIEHCKFRYGDNPVPVTLSSGVTEFRTGDDPDSAFQRADIALYNAKREGRNRCCMAEELDAA